MMRRDREVVDFTRSRVKNNSKLTNLMKKKLELSDIMVNKGRIHRENKEIYDDFFKIDQIGR